MLTHALNIETATYGSFLFVCFPPWISPESSWKYYRHNTGPECRSTSRSIIKSLSHSEFKMGLMTQSKQIQSFSGQYNYKWNNKLSVSWRDLGHIASGMSCDYLRLWSNDTDFAELLQFVSEQPGGTRPALVRKTEHLIQRFISWFAYISTTN